VTADHDRMEDAVAAYVLDACDEDEREVVRAHIEGCPGCRALERRLSTAAGGLPLATEEVRPPDRLRDRILAAAASAPGAGAERPAAPRIVQLPPPDRPRLERRVSGPRRLPLAAAAVAVLVAGLLGLAARNAVLQRQLDQGPARYALTGTGAMASVNGAVTEYPRQDVAVVTFTGMPAPGPGRVYELWLIDEAGRATPGGVFTPDAAGKATIGLDRRLHDVKQVAVTEEAGPAGASAPTQKPQLAGQLGG
jgi:anti-sigma factor RsiW